MEPTPTDAWLRLADAAALAKVSEKTIRNWADSKRIGKRKFKGNALYARRDIEEMAEKQTEMAIVKNAPPVLAGLIAAASGPPAPAALQTYHAAPAILAASHVPLWLTYDQAVIFSGLGASRLHDLVREGKVRTERGPHGSIVLSRADLERLAG
jgi:hypothetical protein